MDLKPVITNLNQSNSTHTTLVPPLTSFHKEVIPAVDLMTISFAGKSLLEKTSAVLAEQNSLLQSLPPQVKEAAQLIMQSALPSPGKFGNGLAEMLNSRRLTTESLLNFANTLELAASVQTQQGLEPRLFSKINRIREQLAQLSQFLFEQSEPNPAVPQQLREKLLSAIPRELQQYISHPSIRDAKVVVPQAAQYTTAELTLQELLKLWQISDPKSIPWGDLQGSALEKSAATVRELAGSVGRAFQTISEDQGQALVLSLQLPMSSDNLQTQPVHIHIYHERHQSKGGGQDSPPDTWVRISLETEHIGYVDVTFHLFGEALLDIKTIFAEKQAALLFEENLASIREACVDFPFTLRDISVL